MSTLSEHRRPRLLPQNRKLRHLKGLSLRNLSFEPAHLRSADDAALDRSPNKLEVLRESGQLHPSRSSDNLRQDSRRPATDALLRPQRPRRTSLSIAHASPVTRQKRLETLVEGAVGDAFFSLHVVGGDDPVYVSEVRERSANFNFQFFELGDQTPDVSRSCRCTIRLWAKRPKRDSWVFLLEEYIDLRQLNFIGSLVDRRFPPNALLFHLEDGLYSFDFPNKVSDPRQAPPVTTSSYNALMKLANLESSIDDALETQRQITDQINRILDETPVDASETAGEEAALADKFVATQQRGNRAAEKRRDDLQLSLKIRREAMKRGREVQAEAEDDIVSNREKLRHSETHVRTTEQNIRGQRRRICVELSDIFPITPIPNAPPLSFQICNIPLPNSVYNATTARTVSEDVLSAALGLVATLTYNLQFYLGHPLPYPVFPYGSRSYARDDISQLTDQGGGGAVSSPRREFPLYLPRGGSTTGQWRFEYGWFLLNKDIEALCASQGLKVVDIRHTLPNLKYLLYVCSAGTDEIPERKKGGVRGLWAGRLKGRMSSLAASAVDHHHGGGDDGSSTAGSRRGSVDSDIMNQHGDALRQAIIKGDANVLRNGGGAVPSPVEDWTGLPFGESDTKFTLRTKGLRENVG